MIKSPENSQPTPFGSELEPLPGTRIPDAENKFDDAKIDQFVGIENSPIVRSTNIAQIKGKLKRLGIEGSNIEIASYCKNLITELEDFKLNLPNPNFVIGKDSDNITSLIITVDRVDGVPLVDRNIDPSEAVDTAKEYDALYGNLIDYLSQAIQQKKPYLWDVFSARQYYHGSTEENQTPKIYLIDLGLEIAGCEKNPNKYLSMVDTDLSDAIHQIALSIRSLEQTLFGQRLVQSRLLFDQLLSNDAITAKVEENLLEEVRAIINH